MEPIAGYVPPEKATKLPVLARFLKPLAANVAAAYIAAYTEEGDLVLNPFCRSGAVAQEAARLGRRSLLSDFNPLVTFVVRASLGKVLVRDLEAGFRRLAETVKGDTTLRNHLLQLYETSCPVCHGTAVAHHFVWSRSLDKPIYKSFYCPTCQKERQEPADAQDLAGLKRIDGRGFHYWAIIERLAPANEDVKALAQRLLALYTPRNLYALAILAAKLEPPFDSPAVLESLRLILLECLDRGSKLTPVPRSRRPDAPLPFPGRPSLRPPAQFLEVNVWEAFEQVYQALMAYRQALLPQAATWFLADDVTEIAPAKRDLWTFTRPDRAVPVMVQRITARRLGEELPEQSAILLLAEPPALATATFLSLSYLWSGWLLGKEAAQVFGPALLLDPKDADDWAWYLEAMASSFRSIGRPLTAGGHVVLVFQERQLDRVRALVLAAAAAGLRLEHLVFQPYAGAGRAPALSYGGTAGEYCLTFGKPAEYQTVPGSQALAKTPSALAAQIQSVSLRAAKEVLALRGEPSVFTWLHSAICLRAGKEGLLQEIMRIPDAGFSPMAFLEENVRAGLEKGMKRDLVQLAAGGVPAAGPEVPLAAAEPAATEPVAADQDVQTQEDEAAAPDHVLWYLAKPKPGLVPLDDQVEEAVYNVLATSDSPTTSAVARVVCSLFPGVSTPELDLIEAVAESYGMPAAGGQRRLREDDRQERRAQEHTGLVRLLVELGHRLGFQVWLPPGVQKVKIVQGTLGGLLSVEERYARPLPAEADVLWYGQDAGMYLFDVEWTARLQRALVDRRMTIDAPLRRYLVVPEERAGLLRFKLSRSLIWSRIVAEDGWDFVKYHHLIQFAACEPDMLAWPGIVGLEPPVEQYGVQLRLL